MNERILEKLEFFHVLSDVDKFCITPYAKELAQCLRPCGTIEEAVDALTKTAQGHAVYRLKGEPPFPVVPDRRDAVRKARNGGILSAIELSQIAQTVNRARAVFAFISSLVERTDVTLLLHVAEPLLITKDLEDEIQACIDEDGLLLDQASETLYDLRRTMKITQERMKRTLDEMIRSATVQKYLQDTIITVRHDRYCLAVRTDSQHQIRGIVHDASASGSTVFIEPERVLQLGNELRRMRVLEEQEVERILALLSGVIKQYADELLLCFEAIGQVDFAVAKGRYASFLHANEPTLVEAPIVHLTMARHPLLDAQKAVPLDVSLGESYHLLIITGPNTGGKTVTLKTVGLLTIMALSGLFIPASSASRIGFFAEVFADIGDEQSIEQNLSTFSSHMRTIVQILHDAHSKTLVLFDELGAGTDPTEGAALAMAILDTLRERNIRAIATTHYSELKAYGYTTPGAMNASMEFDVDTLSPTYRLLIGIPGRSNAFAIASRLGLKRQIIDVAKEKLSTQDVRVEDLITQLEASVVSARKQEEEMSEKSDHAKQLELDWEHKHQNLENEIDSLRKKAQDEIRQQVKQAQREMENLLVELRQAKSSGRTLKDHELTAMRHHLEQLAPKRTLKAIAKSKARQDPDIGDEVRVLTLAGQKAVVMDKRASARELTVVAGTIKMKVSIDDVELLKKAEKRPEPVAMINRSTDFLSPELDLRGTTVEEATMSVDHYLDKAVLSGYHQVSLIHGKGTGALRQGLTTFLKTHPHVKTIRLGVEGEGGSGVTIVSLK